MSHFLFENPWPVAIVLVAVAAVMRLIGRRTERPGLTWGALGLVLAGGAVIGLGYAVTTPRETVRELTHQLVRATLPPRARAGSASPPGPAQVDNKPSPHPTSNATTNSGASTASPIDMRALNRLIGDHATLRGPSGDVRIKPGQLPSKLLALIRKYPFSDNQITSVRVAMIGPRQASVRMSLRTSFESNIAPPTPTTWRITWRRDGQPSNRGNSKNSGKLTNNENSDHNATDHNVTNPGRPTRWRVSDVRWLQWMNRKPPDLNW